jgi:hypothetical protein
LQNLLLFMSNLRDEFRLPWELFCMEEVIDQLWFEERVFIWKKLFGLLSSVFKHEFEVFESEFFRFCNLTAFDKFRSVKFN